jgi:polar amino acid transport system substrate-binding protein
MNKNILIGGLLVVSLATSGAAAESVTIAAEDDWPPYSVKATDRPGVTGFSVELVREAFKTQGVDVHFEVLPFARCLHHAESGKVAGCFNATRIESNKDTYCWHPTPMFEESLLIFGPASTPRDNLRIKDLEGKVVGSTIGYTYGDEFTKNKKIKHFSAVSDEHLIQMLAAGRVDFILLNGMPGYLRINADPKLKAGVKAVGTISIDKFWTAFSLKGDGPRYCTVFEKGLQEIQRNGKYKELEAAFRKGVGF